MAFCNLKSRARDGKSFWEFVGGIEAVLEERNEVYVPAMLDVANVLNVEAPTKNKSGGVLGTVMKTTK